MKLKKVLFPEMLWFFLLLVFPHLFASRFLGLIQLKINYEYTVIANFTSLKKKKMQYRQITRRKKKKFLSIKEMNLIA